MTQQDFWNAFYNSATILWTRLNVLLGCIITVLAVTDMTPWLPPKYLVMWIPINAVLTEYLRRSNTETGKIEVVNPMGIKSDVVYLKSPDPVPKGSRLVKVKE